MTRPEQQRGHPGLVVVATLLVLSGLGLIGAWGWSAARTDSQPVSTPETVTGSVTPPSKMVLPRSTPTRIDIPRIGVSSSLIGTGLNADGTIEVPSVDKPMQASWYRNSPTPGEIGPAVILGHIDSRNQPGIFFRLKELQPGDEIRVTRQDGTVATFRVERREQVAKEKFPTERVYGDTKGPELRLITCGGVFDKGSGNYKDNIIVYAKLVDVQPGSR
ncbi:class F sortase [Longimycelium tulufanense]|uniref:Class F sortase n=1 Tax=Longimycelium tulufanense TaxID=907463 RepID=A0A8J3CI43_9PSEU|nr:class F sortase [Longimycelium tulufanense]GGM80616.1 class F sortase [Longimycelium tulufanense]